MGVQWKGCHSKLVLIRKCFIYVHFPLGFQSKKTFPRWWFLRSSCLWGVGWAGCRASAWWLEGLSKSSFDWQWFGTIKVAGGAAVAVKCYTHWSVSNSWIRLLEFTTYFFVFVWLSYWTTCNVAYILCSCTHQPFFQFNTIPIFPWFFCLIVALVHSFIHVKSARSWLVGEGDR